MRLRLLALCVVAGPALAQTPAGENLSKKLDQSNGVIAPKEVDPAIEKPAPRSSDPNVIAPPSAKDDAPAQAK